MDENHVYNFGVFLDHPEAQVPTKANPSDAGFDLYSVEDAIIPPGERLLVNTGIILDMPDGWEAQIRPRSGHAGKLGLSIVNSPGTVDCFTDKMEILTIDGYKNIHKLSLNDVCLSMDNNGDITKNPILAIVDIGNSDVLRIETESGFIEVTENTKIYTADGIKLAKDLLDGDEILTAPV